MTLLTTLRATSQVLKRRQHPNDLEHFLRAVDQVKVRFPGYKSDTPLNLQDAIKRIEAACLSWDWSKVKQGEIALAMQAVFSGDIEVSAAALSFFDREAEATTRPSLLSGLCQTYLANWDRAKPRTYRLARIIQSRSQYLTRNWVQLFRNLPLILDVDHGPELLAQEMTQQTDPFGWLKQRGVTTPHSGRFMNAVHSAYLRRMEIRTLAHVLAIFRWLYPANAVAAEVTWCATAANTILSACIATEPPADMRQEILARFVGLYGDPRSAKGGFWPLVDGKCRRLVMRWLAGKSIDALLDIITRSTGNHMWGPRHDFWKSLYDRGLIDEAWIALSPAAVIEARAKYEQTGDPVYTMFGEQLSKRKETCLLIMRMGNSVVVEGSHDYRVHIYDQDTAPQSLLYRDVYDAEAMTFAANDPRARIHDPYGAWRRWVEERVLP